MYCQDHSVSLTDPPTPPQKVWKKCDFTVKGIDRLEWRSRSRALLSETGEKNISLFFCEGVGNLKELAVLDPNLGVRIITVTYLF
ncbi:hypothetical protein CEXT_229151 [Caerostris extrusa]|uniref:Uncharacterized protein n=1 Tax=Caerostris extrusa TaxID=172846 RepID=A0AAV4MSG6_CAEEX|nr:hypothetical protein CEXT_229151 [Caerostris extrusa]